MARFNYDSFGNLRNGSRVAASLPRNAGGDFRFQGQWLDEATGLYNFRARYYDPETGRFMSYDPIDLIEMEPESSNPYQFVYNNPHVYSDPTGMFTMIELNAADSLRNILEYGRSYIVGSAREFIKEKAGDFLGNVLVGALNSLIPGSAEGTALVASLAKLDAPSAGTRLETFLTGQICGLVQGSSFSERLWIAPEVATSGVPHSNGLNCSEYINPVALATGSPRYPNPDFLFKQGRPTDYSPRNPDAYLIGDIKLTMNKALSHITGDYNQWQAMYRHARRFQRTPFTLYVSFRLGNQGAEKIAARTQLAQKKAFQKNVVLFLLNIFD